MLSQQELAKIEAHRKKVLDESLAEARDDHERAALIAHATTPGDCDAEYCPWSGFKESLCIREQTHDPNCRCPECCAFDDDD